MKHKCPRTRQISEVAIIVKIQGQDFKIYGSNIKVMLQGTCIWKFRNTKALSLTIQKIWPKLKFLKSGSNFKVKVTRSKIMAPLERSCRKKHTYEIPITYHSKYMANVKVFEKWVKLQGQGHKVKNFGNNRKVLS
jgi:hypothetical protein